MAWRSFYHTTRSAFGLGVAESMLGSPVADRSDDLDRLVRSLWTPTAFMDRLRGRDPRIAALDRIAEAGELRVVPDLLFLLPCAKALAPHVGRVIADLVRSVTPAQLAVLDQRVRPGMYVDTPGSWTALTPAAVRTLARACDLRASVIGLLGSHGNGYVRAEAIEVLAQHVDGDELPYLALRVNDWVPQVAARATTLLLERLRPDNLDAVIRALPFLARTLGQRRRGHGEIVEALRVVLQSDGGVRLLEKGAGLATPVRRIVFPLLAGVEGRARVTLVDAALRDVDDVIRARAIAWIDAGDGKPGERGRLLERLGRDDPSPVVRRRALAELAVHAPERIGGICGDLLLDRSARVRACARDLVRAYGVPLVPRDLYVEHLRGDTHARRAAALDGLGESGIAADAALVAPHLASPSPGIRKAAVRALGRLDAARGIAAAVTAIGDDASSVRRAAAAVVAANARAVDFARVGDRIRSIPDASVRRDLVPLLWHAGKWEAAAQLLEVYGDPDPAVRAQATDLLDRWLVHFNRAQVPPTEAQRQRIAGLMDAHVTHMPAPAARELRFVVKSR